MLFASFQSDSLGDKDWQNLSTIDLSGTSGFVTLTGAEAGCFGLLGDLKGPVDIIGGTGNSFYDLTALTFTAAAGSSIQGGSNTVFDATVSELPGWSEVAFNNDVWTEHGASEGGNTVIALSNISIGDDASCTQGGSINMANFPLTPLSNPYALIAEPNPPSGTVPFGLPYTYNSTANLLPDSPTLGDYLQEGVVPAGFEVLQLLNCDGSTAVELSSNLDILNGPSYFAVNMQDVSDCNDHYNVSITGVESAQQLVLFVSDGCSPPYCGEETVTVTTTGADTSDSVSNEVFSIPILTITNYQNVNIVLPSELACDGHDVGLGTKGFVVVPSDTELNTTVNFYDNVADTGGSPPGCEDNLYLGYTQTYGFEQYGYTDAFPGHILYPESGCFTQAELIGSYSVAIEVNLDYATPPLSTINDFGTGRFEIGGTDATNINAQSTGQTGDGGLIMDLPASYYGALGAVIGGSDENFFFETYGNENGQTPLGITVNGSEYGTNLLQGTSGPIAYDYAAYANPEYNDAYFGAVGNNTLTGGPFDDNYFPEGGNTTINLADAWALTSTGVDGASASTVWFGFYDVGYSGCFETGTCPGAILAQAITDVAPWSSTGEQFVNEYGNDLLTINGFAFGPQDALDSAGNPTVTCGTKIIFGTDSWATDITVDTYANGPQTVQGLTQWDGSTLVSSQVAYQLDLAPATFHTIGGAADNLATNAISAGTDIVLYNLGTFSSAGGVQYALTHEGVGDIEFAGPGLANNHTADFLLAYAAVGTPNPTIDIADITVNNHTGATITDTDMASSLTVTNLISINNPGLVGVAELGTNPIFFTHA